MNRPEPLTFSVCTPPVPVVVEKIEVQVELSVDVWIWNAVANAASQFSTTWHTDCVDPRSTSSHCGSENALDQRVPVLPSTAADAGKLAFSSDDAVAVLFSATFVVPQPPPLPVPANTWNSHSEYPNWVARVVPNIRMNRPLPDTFSVCTPPVPAVVEKIDVHVDPSGETWIWNAVANAASQFSTTWHTDCVDPRSTSSHCGSENALDQRVPVLPSTAADAGKLAFSSDDAVAVLFSATFVVPQPPPLPVPANTWNSHSEYPNWVARVVPNIRMNRPLPDTFSVCTPPVPAVVEKIDVHVDPSGETWIWNAVANAASQFSTTWHTDCVDPRSTSSHCGSENALDQRVPVLPSTAA